MMSGYLFLASVAALLSTVACKDHVFDEIPVTNENGLMGIYTDAICRSAGFTPAASIKHGVSESEIKNDNFGRAYAQTQLSASKIILIVLAVTVGIIITAFLANFLYNKAKSQEYSL